MKSFAAKVKEERENLGWNQAALGEKIGVSVRSVSAYETGSAKPRGIMARRLAAVFQISLDYLLNDDIEDRAYGKDKTVYIEEALVRFGEKGAHELDGLLEQNLSLFAGGEISQEAKDAFFEAVMTAYITSKEEARRRFGRKSTEVDPPI